MTHIKNLKGEKFGKLTVIEIADERNEGRVVWTCKCDCGEIAKAESAHLVNGATKSCGRHQCRPNFKDLRGKIFGSLTVTKISDRRGKRGAAYWECECICGKIVTVFGASMSCGKTRSCGCIKHSKQYETIKKMAYATHKNHAKEKGIVSELSYEQYVQIASNICYYCGSIDIKKNVRTKNTIKLNGIDRKNNECFYKIENSLPCCKDCNFMKRDVSYEKFISKIEKIYNYTNLNPKDKTESDQ